MTQGGLDEPDMKLFTEAMYELCHMVRLEHFGHLGLKRGQLLGHLEGACQGFQSLPTLVKAKLSPRLTRTRRSLVSCPGFTDFLPARLRSNYLSALHWILLQMLWLHGYLCPQLPGPEMRSGQFGVLDAFLEWSGARCPRRLQARLCGSDFSGALS